MLWLQENGLTVAISLVLLVIAFLIVRSQIKQKRAGRTSCGAGCAECPMHGSCHSSSKS